MITLTPHDARSAAALARGIMKRAGIRLQVYYCAYVPTAKRVGFKVQISRDLESFPARCGSIHVINAQNVAEAREIFRTTNTAGQRGCWALIPPKARRAR